MKDPILPKEKSCEPIGDISFGLSDDDFARWWNYALTPEDASEYCSLYKGTLDGARLVCALMHLTQVQKKPLASPLIVQAYCLAMNLPDSEATRHHVKVSAQGLYDEDYVRILIDRVRYRGRASAQERIASLVESKIVELFERSKQANDPEECLAIEKMALDAGIRHMANATKERNLETTRIEKRAHREALDRAAVAEKQQSALPTVADARKFLELLKSEYSTEEFAEVTKSLNP